MNFCIPINWYEFISTGLADFLCQLQDNKCPDKVESDDKEREDNGDKVRDVPGITEEVLPSQFLQSEELRIRADKIKVVLLYKAFNKVV